MNIADPHHWSINTCFGAFCNLWVHLVPYRYRTKLGAKRPELEQLCEDSCHEVALEFFIMNAPDPCHWTLNSCFAAFRTVWVHLRPFGCLTKLGAKRFELLQKFVPRRRVRVFRDEHTLSTPLDPKLTFWCASYYLGAFEAVWFPYESRYKTVRTSAKVRARSRVRIFRNECT